MSYLEVNVNDGRILFDDPVRNSCRSCMES